MDEIAKLGQYNTGHDWSKSVSYRARKRMACACGTGASQLRNGYIRMPECASNRQKRREISSRGGFCCADCALQRDYGVARVCADDPDIKGHRNQGYMSRRICLISHIPIHRAIKK